MIQNVILFHGENTYLLNQTLKEWIKAFANKHGGDMNLEILDEKPQASDILNKAQSMPFLAEKRMVVVKNFLSKASKEDQHTIAENITEIPDYSILIFAEFDNVDKRTSLFKKLNTSCRVEYFENLSGLNLTNFILKEVEKNGSTISKQNADYLTIYIGNDMWKLASEIQKLCLFKINQEINKEDIENISVPLLETTVFKLTDNMGLRKHKESINLLEQLINMGEELPMIFHMLVRQFRLITLIKELKSQGLSSKEIADTLKQHPFVVSNVSKQADNFSFDDIYKIYENLLEIEISQKTGKIQITTDDKRDLTLAMEKFLLTI